MGLQLQKGAFTSLAEVMDDVKAAGGWPTTFVSPPSDGLPVHWHAHEVACYIMEGETDFLDAESGERIAVAPGDKLVIPAGALHAEGPVKDKVVYILATPGPLGRKEFLAMQDPAAAPAAKAAAD
jgi:quercetin dioxygenase-like cupin family protein